MRSRFEEFLDVLVTMSPRKVKNIEYENVSENVKHLQSVRIYNEV